MGFLAAIPAAYVALAGTAVAAGMQIDAANRREDQARDDAAYERDAAEQQAMQIMRARRKQVASARAATAASGTELDSFAEINTSEIERLGSSDEQMTLLTGERRGRSLVIAGEEEVQSAKSAAIGDLISTGYQAGWKGKRG